MAARTLDFPLVGGGGEPIDLWRTLISHGLTALPPFRVDDDARTLEVTVPLDGVARTIRIAPGVAGRGSVETVGRPLSARHAEAALAVVRKMLRLDEDLSGFYARAVEDPDLAWAAAGAGRLLRSPTVFEDVVKTRGSSSETAGVGSYLGLPMIRARSGFASTTSTRMSIMA